MLELTRIVTAASLAVVVRRLRQGPLRPGWPFPTELSREVMQRFLANSSRRGVAWLRTVEQRVPRLDRALRRVRLETGSLAGVPVLRVEPRDVTSPRTLLYFHGGGYVMGSAQGHRELLARLALETPARVVGVNYRLAPEHRFPAAHDDALEAWRALLAGGADPASCALGGDSAGGALAAATLLSARDAGLPLPAAGLLISPWVEPLAEGGSMSANEPWDFGGRALLLGWIEAYADPAGIRDPRVTLVDAALEGLPPLLVQWGEAEVLRDQVRRFAERAAAAGVDVTSDEVPEMFHDFQLFPTSVAAAPPAIARLAGFLRERVEG